MNSFILYVSVLIAAVVPRISAIMGLVGAIGFSTTGILFPIIFDIFSFPVGNGFSERARQIKNYVLIVIYCIILVLGTYTSILDLVS